MPNTSPASGALSALVGFLHARDYAFITPTPLTHARVLRRHGGAAADLRDAFGWSRAFERSLLPDALFDALKAADLLVREGELWRSRVRVSSLEGMSFVHSAYPTDAADAVFFGPDTYRFVSAIKRDLDRCPDAARVVEIGCGSGAAGVFIARERPGADVTLADINQRALDISAVNAAAAGVTNTTVAYSDILSDLPGAFDYIVANPPYLVDPAHRSYRDGGGLWGADLSLRILQQATERLTAGGCALIYTGSAVVAGRDVFKHEAARLLASPHLDWTYEEIDPDVFGEELDTPAYAEVDRIAAVALRLTKR